ncbi:bifunctional ADP-dependent NAD(P)H-hydrate dehydratase/NAD(P)H-hydrate epimerase, partial [bacterium]|nr:bifunctional ADP-dependent NAD(P)H-hydrate dehydratase/NAD(P)H-hydrate epimerase [bacterium]
MKLVTVAQMRALEQAAVDAGSSFDQLMEEAGLAVAQEAWMLLGSLEGCHIVALAGPGNNGGDALVAARHLADWGADVAAYIPRQRRDATHEQALLERGLPIVHGEDDDGNGQLDALLSVADLVIDGLLGIGQERPLDPAEPIGLGLARLREARGRYQPPKLVAVDIPTGVAADTGAV